jgi:Replication initiation factor
VTKKLKTATTIDWYEGSLPEACDGPAHLKETAARVTNTRAADWHDDKAFNRYNIGARHDSGARALTGRADMGTHLIVSGSALAALKTVDRSSVDLIALTLDYDMRPTRIDLAIDAIDSGFRFGAAFRELRAGRAETKASTWYLVQSGEDGWTLYIGAPQSDKHMRVYNKEAELAHKATAPPGITDWVRVELVLMRSWARRAARVAVQDGAHTACVSYIRDFISMPTVNAWAEIVAGRVSLVGASTRKITDTKRWLLQVAARTLARETIADPTLYGQFIESVQQHYLDLTNPQSKTVNSQPD